MKNFILEAKSEMQKINVCIGRRPDNNCVSVIPGEQEAVTAAVAREIAALSEAERLPRVYYRYRRCNCPSCTAQGAESRIRGAAFADPTIYYRFVNQSFYNNLTGRSNVNITELAQKARNEHNSVYKKYNLT